MAQGSGKGPKETHMQGSGNLVRPMAMECIPGSMETAMKANLKIA